MGEEKMRTRLPVIFTGICAAAFTAGVLYAQFKQGAYRPAELGTMQQAAPVALSTDAVYEVSAYPVPVLELAPGEGRQEIQIYCNTCHGPRYLTMQPPLPAATWEAEVNKMTKTFGATIPDEGAKKIIQYLQAHYTPETRNMGER
jgi:mono/diheme cytochrome c family protein